MPEHKRMLTAEEGADRVAAKYGHGRDLAHRDNRNENESPYRCENCGGREFYVVHEWSSQKTVNETLPCECGDYEVAATREICITRANAWTGRLTPEHHLEWDEKNKEDEREVVDTKINCKDCFTGLDGSNWEVDDNDDFEDIKEDQQWEVHCSECDHEVEFGWSHPEGGRIWPCESLDFNPWLTWPESRFVDSWNRRGWVRPARSA